MRETVVVLGAFALVAIGLVGCNGAAQKKDESVDYYCRECAVYVGDYDRATEVPRVDAGTRKIMAEDESQGEYRHVADSAAVVVRQSRDMPNKVFDPQANDVNQILSDWAKRQYENPHPWQQGGRAADYAAVARWIREHRMDLGPSALLDRELSEAK